MVGGETQAVVLAATDFITQSRARNDHEPSGRDFRATHTFAAEPTEPAEPGESGVVESFRPTGGLVDLPNARSLPQILSWLTDITAGCQSHTTREINVSSV
jgi:hypothetical protein